jgi:cytochrome c553
MAQVRRTILTWLAATSMGVAASFVAPVGAARAEPLVASPERTLAAELRVVRGDLDRLDEAGLSGAHRAGLEARIAGGLGLLPWLLTASGDAESANRLTEAAPDDFAALATGLDAILARHPFDLAERGTAGVGAKALLEARAIHESYCAGCHDDAGNGDPEMELPIRDLFEMARTEAGELFAARLYVGIKGDETIGFRNPLSETQFLALWRYYSTD